MSVKLLTEHHLGFLSSKGGCRGSSKSILVKMSNCWKSNAAAHISVKFNRTVGYIFLNTILYCARSISFIMYGLYQIQTLCGNLKEKKRTSILLLLLSLSSNETSVEM